MTAYKLYYFQQRGLGEPIRLILSYLKIPFQDVRIDENTEWIGQLKPKTPLGNLPVLVLEDGRELSQSTSICRFLGEKHGLVSQDLMERYTAEWLLQSGWEDMLISIGGVFQATDKNHKKQLYDDMIANHLNPRLTKLEKYFAERKCAYCASDKVLWADFVLYNNFFKAVEMWVEHPLTSYSKISEYIKKIEALPGVKECLDKHKDGWCIQPSDQVADFD